MWQHLQQAGSSARLLWGLRLIQMLSGRKSSLEKSNVFEVVKKKYMPVCLWSCKLQGNCTGRLLSR